MHAVFLYCLIPVRFELIAFKVALVPIRKKCFTRFLKLGSKKWRQSEFEVFTQTK